MRRAATSLLAVLLLAGGCDGAFDPQAADDRHFAVYGLLDARQSLQRFRVEDLAGPLDPPEVLPARVTLRDLETGASAEGRDSLVTLDDGSRGHVFVVPLPVMPGRRYEVEVVRSDDPAARTTARVALPAPFVAEPAPPIGEPDLTQMVTIPAGTLPPSTPLAVYDVRVVATGAARQVALPQAAFPGTDGLLALVQLSADVATLRDTLGLAPGDTLALERIALRYVQADTEAAGVTNGLGQLGWVATFESPWRLDIATLDALGLLDAQGTGP